MSTTFGIFKSGGHIVLNEDDCIPDRYDLDDFEPIAFRSNGGMRWLNSLAKHLPPDTRVYPLDNTPQGVYTIGDVIREVEKNEKGA